MLGIRMPAPEWKRGTDQPELTENENGVWQEGPVSTQKEGGLTQCLLVILTRRGSLSPSESVGPPVARTSALSAGCPGGTGGEGVGSPGSVQTLC